MKDWLEKQKKAENDMLEAVSVQARQVTEDLIPQVRLCALENEMCADIVVRVHFEFNEDNSEIWSEGAVQFPPRQSVSQCFEIGYGSEQEESSS
jgi:hypothetical protein|tara:strand:+ start:1401 stop:1682 length:282 start_codon:yes stop_codon:yes gene_type:complete